MGSSQDVRESAKDVAKTDRYGAWCVCPSCGTRVKPEEREREWVGDPAPEGTACYEIRCPKCANRMVVA